MMEADRFGAEYERAFAGTVRFLVAKRIDVSVAEEAAQAAWCKGWERRWQLREANRLTAWIRSIALNLYRDSMRRNYPCGRGASPQSSMDAVLAQIDVHRLLAVCPDDERMYFEQRLEGYTAAESSVLAGVPAATIRSRLTRARSKLRLIGHLKRQSKDLAGGSKV